MPAAKHVIPDFGLPYAAADFDSAGRYRVVCPVCAEKCYPAVGDADAFTEDGVTKGANLSYALHFEAAAKADAVPAGFISDEAWSQ